jgi:hypothetical protein
MLPPLFRRPPLVAGLLAVAAGLVSLPAPPTVSAQAAGGLPPHLAPVPADAAFFAHADVAALWDTPAFKAIRAADPKTFAEMTAEAKKVFGTTPDKLRTATLFIPKVKDPNDPEKLGVILTFAAPFDVAKMRAGLGEVLPGKNKFKLVTPNPTTAVVLVGLDDIWADARPADKTGPLTDAIKAAATGKHAAVIGTALASLPDEVRGDNLPDFVRAFSPILKSDAVYGTLDAGKDFTFDVRVKATTPGQAGEAEKALGLLRDLMKEGLNDPLKEVERQGAVKEVATLLKALQTGLGGAKFSTDKSEARAVVTIPADQPFGAAWVDGVQKVREAAAAARSQNNLKQLALAMHNYESTYATFPPAAVCDKTGKPMLSWRVLILPYIEQQELYKQFKLDEPWDSDHNKKLLAKMPPVYSALDKPKPGETTTHYRVFVGNGAGFDYLKGPKIFDIQDGTSNTYMIATAADAVPWTKPDEVAFDPEKDTGKLLGAVVGGRVQVAMFDGSVRSLNKVPEKKNLNAHITRAGGEVVADDN